MTSAAVTERIASAREQARLVLTALRDDTQRQLLLLDASPELKKHSPHHVARLQTLYSALHVALDDMAAADAAASGDG